MRIKETEVAAAVSNVGDFMRRHDAVLGTLNTSGARAALDAIDAELDGHATNQSAGTVNSQRGTVTQRTLRTTLRTHHMLPIARIARTQLQTVPDYSELKLPNIRLNSEKLVAQARSMAQVAHDHESVFVSMGLPADFVDQLNAAASALHASLISRSAQGTRRVGATKGLIAVASRARQQIAVIDAMVMPMIENNPALVAEWKSAKAIRRTRVASAAATPPVATPPVATPPVAVSGNTPAPAATA